MYVTVPAFLNWIKSAIEAYRNQALTSFLVSFLSDFSDARPSNHEKD